MEKGLQHLVYGLADPATHEIRYVGVTANVLQRWRTYMSAHAQCYETRDWLRELRERGMLPEFRVLELTDAENADRCERKWIYAMKAQGNRLLHGKKITSAIPRNKMYEAYGINCQALSLIEVAAELFAEDGREDLAKRFRAAAVRARRVIDGKTLEMQTIKPQTKRRQYSQA